MILKESMFCCPVCGGRLFALPSCLRCIAGHSFDIAKQGYVNLLMSNSGGKRHGDDSLMVAARRNFLDKGYYEPLRDAITDIAGINHTVLDAGCGEGYYTAAVAAQNRVCGIDISKDALRYAAKRCQNAEFAVASISDIPISDSSVDTVISIFAPDSPAEFRRVLSDGGRLITVVPMENHLAELKAAIYDVPYLNPRVDPARDGFELISSREVKYDITLEAHEDIASLFKMTPYYYKTSRTDQQKAEALERLTTRLEFFIAEYKMI